MKKIISMAMAGVILLTGCVAATMESAHIATDTAIRNNNMGAALAGYAEAQFRVGKSYCCAPRNDADVFYNNRLALDFLYKAARQSHAEAAYAIGRFHSVDIVDGIRILRGVATAIRQENVNDLQISYFWIRYASELGNQNARDDLRLLSTQDLSSYSAPDTTPGTIAEVYGG